MKKLVILILLCFCGLWASAQNLVEDFFKKFGDSGVFTIVNVNAKMFSLIADITDPETEGIIKNLTGFRLLKTESKMANAHSYYQEALALLKDKKEYEELMRVQEKIEDVRIYVREVKGIVTELVVLVFNPREFVLMGFTGNIDLKQISKLSKTVNVSGMEYLDKAISKQK